MNTEEVQYQISRSEYSEASIAFTKAKGVYFALKLSQLILVLLAFAAVYLGLFVTRVFLAFGAVLLLYGYEITDHGLIRFLVLSSLYNRLHRGRTYALVSVNEQGIQLRSDYSLMNANWKHFDMFANSKTVIVLIRSDNTYIVLPKSVFIEDGGKKVIEYLRAAIPGRDV